MVILLIINLTLTDEGVKRRADWYIDWGNAETNRLIK